MKILLVAYYEPLEEFIAEAMSGPLGLVATDRPILDMGSIQPGLALVAASLKEAGHQVELFVITPQEFGDGFGGLLKRVAEWAPGVVGFTLLANCVEQVDAAARAVRRAHPDVYLVVGGAHCQLVPDRVLTAHAPFDAMCTGEGDHVVPELVEHLARGERPTSVLGFWFRLNGTVVRNANPPFIQNLDALPIMDREMWRPWTMGAKTHVMLISRGCPFQCTYCSNHKLMKVSEGRYTRLRSASSIVGELRLLVAQFPELTAVYLETEMLNVRQNHALELCRALAAFNQERSAKLRFGANLGVMPRTDWDALFDAMARAGFLFVNIGLESGSPRIRASILKREYSNALFEHVCARARHHGLRVNVYVLVGIPGETEADFDETVGVLRTAKPDLIWHSIFEPYPGTELYQVTEEMGLVGEPGESALSREFAQLDLPGFPRAKIQEAFDTLYERAGLGSMEMCAYDLAVAMAMG